jgi:8-oxo-dGTP diphosphatase
VTVVVACEVDEPTRPPVNPLEITEVRLFRADELPASMAFGMQDMIAAAIDGRDPVLE